MMRTLLSCLIAVCAAPAAAATVVNVSDVDGLRSAITGAIPGSEIVLAGGTYELTAPLVINARGTATAPILVHGVDGAAATINQTVSGDIITLNGVTNLTLRNLTLTGGARGVHIVASDNITLVDLVIHDVGQSAITANDSTTVSTYAGLIISSNDIYNFGTARSGQQAGINIGCLTGGCTVTGPIVALNYIHDKATTPVGLGDGILMQPGVSGADVRDNIVVGVNGRGIAVLGSPQPSNLIQRNAVWSTSGVGVDVTGGVTIRNTIIIDTATAGLRAGLGSGGAVTNLSIINNSILVSGIAAVSVTSPPQDAVVIANNALFGATALNVATGGAEPTVIANVGSGAPVGVTDGVTTGVASTSAFVNAQANAATLDVFPRVGGPLVGAGDAATQAPDDFNSTTRGNVADVGAYVFASTGNPGWPLAAGFKSLEPAGSGTGGSGGGSGGAGGSGSPAPGEAIPIPANDNKQGCAATTGSWAMGVFFAAWWLVRRGRRARARSLAPQSR